MYKFVLVLSRLVSSCLVSTCLDFAAKKKSSAQMARGRETPKKLNTRNTPAQQKTERSRVVSPLTVFEGSADSRFTILDEKPPDGYTWSWERLTRQQTTSRPDTMWPEFWKDMLEASKRRENQKWTIEKPKLDNARKLCGIYFIDPAYE